MTYDPFARGPFPVGVRTFNFTDPARDRLLPIEVWYPATDAHTGQDVAPATRDTYELFPGFPASGQDAVRDAGPRPGKFPLVAFSHGFAGHRRQSTFLCTHLASHGYVVAAVDHTGNTVFEMMQWIMQVQLGGQMPDPVAMVTEFIANRPADVSVMIDALQGGALDGMHEIIDGRHVGMTGHSFGGWTTLVVTQRDRRIGAALPLAPAGGSTTLPAEPIKAALDFNWGREVPTLYLVADRDTLLPLPGMHELLEKTPSKNKRMAVLRNADHMHFCDNVEQIHEMFRAMPPPGDFERIAKSVPPIGELCPGEHAHHFTRGLGLAHMDAHLKGNESAARLLAGDVRATLGARGIAIDLV
jgi:dienelactone hydrolase